MMLDSVRWGMIGCGDVAEVKSGPAFARVPGSELVAVMRRNQELAADYARRHGVPKWYSNAEQLIADPDVNAIYIATPPGSHHMYTLQAAAAGKPVYVEKPMAVNYRQCREMIDACDQAQVPLFVAYYRRALPRFLQIRSLLAEKAIGDVRFVSIQQYQKPRIDAGADDLPWRVQPDISGGGLAWDLGSHTLDLMDFLLGPIIRACGCVSNQAGLYEPEDTTAAALEFSGGILGTALWNFCAHDDVDCNTIVGSSGQIRFSTFGREPAVLISGDGRKEYSSDFPSHIQEPLIAEIVAELQGGRPASSTGRTAARTNRVLEVLAAGKNSCLLDPTGN